jgi:hypothetical protein
MPFSTASKIGFFNISHNNTSTYQIRACVGMDIATLNRLVSLLSVVDTVNHTVTAHTDHFSWVRTFDKPIPEPKTCALLGLGVLGLFALTWRRRQWRK